MLVWPDTAAQMWGCWMTCSHQCAKVPCLRMQSGVSWIRENGSLMKTVSANWVLSASKAGMIKKLVQRQPSKPFPSALPVGLRCACDLWLANLVLQAIHRFFSWNVWIATKRIYTGCCDHDALERTSLRLGKVVWLELKLHRHPYPSCHLMKCKCKAVLSF